MARDRSTGDSTQTWPVCPQCGTRRTVRCPFCKTTGDDFRGAVEVDQLLGLPLDSGAAGPCCGPGGCTPVGHADESPSQENSAAPGPMLVCPTCDEPQPPQYLRCCGQCGHDFGEGVDAEPGDSSASAINPRIVLAMVAVAALVGLLVWHFSRLF